MGREIKFNQPHRAEPESWDSEQALVRALYERDRFLEMNPQYMDFQREIDYIMSKAGNTENRMTVLAMLMEEKMGQLNKQFQKLSRVLLEKTAVSD